MKGLKLAVAILALATIAISPKADARSLFNTRQILRNTIIAQVTNTYKESSLFK